METIIEKSGSTKQEAHTLVLKNCNADIRIQVANSKYIMYNLTGPKELVEKYTCMELKNGVFEISSANQGAHISARAVAIGRGSVAVSTGNVSVSVINGQVYINGQLQKGDNAVQTSKATLVVSVPLGINITMSGLSGDAHIGDIDGVLLLNANLVGEVQCGRMRRAEIQISGTTNVHITEITDVLHVQITGTGDVDIASGNVSILSVHSSGTGDFDFRGTCEMANLTTTGTGDIRVAKVTSHCSKTNTGVGKIRVG